MSSRLKLNSRTLYPQYLHSCIRIRNSHEVYMDHI